MLLDSSLSLTSLALLLLYITWKEVVPLVARRNGASAGSRSVEFWESRVRQIISEELTRMTTTLEKMSTNLTELVTIARDYGNPRRR